MKIAITGARGTVGRAVVKTCSKAGHHTVQVNRTEEEFDGTPNSEMRTADSAEDYEATVKAFQGCDAVIHLAAIPNPVDKDDHKVHANNVNSAFIGMRAAAEIGIKRFAYVSSVNAIGLAYANRPLEHFDYFPIDEEAKQRPTDSYALAKAEAEVQAHAFVDWFPGMNISVLRVHEVATRAEVAKEHSEDWDNAGVRQLWGWVHPEATARACLRGVETDKVKGCEVFNIHAPTTAQETPSRELAKKYFPNVEIRGKFEANEAFFTSAKANKLLDWVHTETE